MDEPKMAVNLRPLSLPELLDRAIRIYRNTFLVMIGSVAVVQIPVTLLTILFTILGISSLMNSTAAYTATATATANPLAMLETPGYIIGMAGLLLVGLVSGYLMEFSRAALVHIVSCQSLGMEVGFGEAWRTVLNRAGAITLLYLLSLIIGVLLFFWLLIPCVGWITGIGILLVFFLGVYPLLMPVLMVESRTGFDIFRRAWNLVRRRMWWVLGFAFVLYILSLVLVSGPAMVANWILQFIISTVSGTSSASARSLLTLLPTIAQSLTSMLMQLFFLPISVIGYVLVYYDLRIRYEGLDLSYTAAQSAGRPVEEVLRETPAPAEMEWISGKEFRNLVFITLPFLLLISICCILPYALMLPALLGGYGR